MRTEITRTEWAVSYVDAFTGRTRVEWFSTQARAEAWAARGGWTGTAVITGIDLRTHVLDY